MARRQLGALFLCNLVVWAVGGGLIPLLPVHAARLGAGPVSTGYYLSLANLTMAIGTFAAGWLSDRLQRRKALLIIAGIVNVPLTWLMGQATTIYQLAALTATAWFFSGMQLALLGILTGLLAEGSERGKVFGILGMTSALAKLLTGFTTGSIADRWGYPSLFMVVALWGILLPVCGSLLEDRVVVQSRANRRAAAETTPRLGRRFMLFLLANLFVSAAMFVGILGRSLSMHRLGFLSAAIASTGIAGGAVSLPLSPLTGWLSDRFGRKWLLVLAYVVGAAGLLVLSTSRSLWHFWIAVSLLTLMGDIRAILGSALVTDLVPHDSLGTGISLFQLTFRVSGIIGFAGTGHAVERLGMPSALAVGGLLALIAAGLLMPIRETQRSETVTT